MIKKIILAIILFIVAWSLFQFQFLGDESEWVATIIGMCDGSLSNNIYRESKDKKKKI